MPDMIAPRSTLHAPTRGTRFPLRLVVFATLIGVLSPFLQGYTYMAGDQLEYLPALERRLDPEYLPGDFFTHAASRFGPRFFFTELMALPGASWSTPALYLGFTLLNNLLVSILTALAAWRMFGGSIPIGAFACAVVMSVQSFSLGHAAYLHLNFLTPQHLATPFALGAVWLGMTGRLIGSQFLAGIGALLHPILGLEAGGLTLIASAGARWSESRGSAQSFRTFLAAHGGGVLILLAWAAIWVIPYASLERIDTKQFLQILVYYRCPHHFLPSSFPVWNYLETFCFLAASAVAWRIWRERIGPSQQTWLFPALMVGALGFLCLGSYIFVEIIPTRSWAQLQPFRMLMLLKWFGIILCAGAATHFLKSPASRAEKLAALAALLCLQTPPASALSFLNLRWGSRIPGRGAKGWLIASTVVLVFGIWNCWEIFTSWRQREVTAFSFFLLMAALLGSRASLTRLLLNGLLFLVLLLSTARPDLLPAPHLLRSHYPLSSLKPALFTEAHQFRGLAEIAGVAREQTSFDALFLTPPQFAAFRLLAHRAIVVDVKCMPFQDKDLEAWYNRVLDCYHEAPPMGTIRWQDLNPELLETYQRISDDKLRRLQRKYGFQYAILSLETKTSYPAIGEAGGYKICRVAVTDKDEQTPVDSLMDPF